MSTNYDPSNLKKTSVRQTSRKVDSVPLDLKKATTKDLVRHLLEAFLSSSNSVISFYNLRSRISATKDSEIIPHMYYWMKNGPPMMRLAASIQLHMMGERHGSIASQMIQFLTCNDMRLNIESAILLSSVEALPDQLREPLGALMRTSRPDLAQYFRTTNPSVTSRDLDECLPWARVAGAAALTRIDRDLEAFQILRSALRNQDPTLKLISARALCWVGVCIEESVSALELALKCQDIIFQLMSLSFMLPLNPAHFSGVLPTLVTILENPRTDQQVRVMATSIVGQIARKLPPSPETSRAFRRLLRSQDWLTACLAADYQPEAANLKMERIQPFLELLGSADPQVRLSAATALERLTSVRLELLEPLIERGRLEPDLEVFGTIGKAIVRIGKPAVPRLTELVFEGDGKIMPMALIALAKVEPESLRSCIAKILGNDDEVIRYLAVHLLPLLQEKVAIVLPEAIFHMRGNDPEKRLSAIVAVSGIGVLASEAVPELIRAFLDDDPMLHLPSEKGILNIGQPAVPTLRDAYSKATGTRRERLISILTKLGAMEIPNAAGDDDFSLIRDDVAVCSFLAIVDVIANKSASSLRGAADEIDSLRRLGTLPYALASPKEQGLRGHVKRLEEILTRANGRDEGALKLFETKRNRTDFSRLTEEGLQYWKSMSNYISAHSNKILERYEKNNKDR